MDLNDLRTFERVAGLKSFSAAARFLGIPKSSVSRSVSRLENHLNVRLFQRTTRSVVLTPYGEEFYKRCQEILGRIESAVDYVGSLGALPSGSLNISAGIGFGINVLSSLIPRFLEQYPAVTISLDLSSHPIDLVAEGIDVAIRMGPLPDASHVAVRLGTLRRHLCASPAYIARKGMPLTLNELNQHDTVEMPGLQGRTRPWIFLKIGAADTVSLNLQHRVCVNEAITVHKLISNGAGIGIASGYLVADQVKNGTLLKLFPEWTLPSVDVSIVFPSNRQLAPTVRAFVDFMKSSSQAGRDWLDDPL